MLVLQLSITQEAQDFIRQKYQNIHVSLERKGCCSGTFEPAVFAGKPISIELYDTYKIGDIEAYILKDTFSSVEVFLVKFHTHKYLSVDAKMLV